MNTLTITALPVLLINALLIYAQNIPNGLYPSSWTDFLPS